MTENTPSEAMVDAMELWDRADRAGEDAYVEAVQIGVESADDAHKCGAIAAAAVIADALAERDAEIARLRAKVERGASAFTYVEGTAYPVSKITKKDTTHD